MFHWFRKLFFKKKKVKAGNITKYRGHGSSRQGYDQSSDTWFYLYLLEATDSNGCHVDLDKSSYAVDSYRDIDSSLQSSSYTSDYGSSSSSYGGSSSSGGDSSYDSGGSSSSDW